MIKRPLCPGNRNRYNSCKPFVEVVPGRALCFGHCAVFFIEDIWEIPSPPAPKASILELVPLSFMKLKHTDFFEHSYLQYSCPAVILNLQPLALLKAGG